MAFRSNGPINLALPPFRGVTRRIVLIAVGCFLALLLLSALLPGVVGTLAALVLLKPDKAAGRQIWQLVTYPFFGNGLLGLLFGALSVWFFGSTLEDERGPRWMGEYFLTTTVLGGVTACALAFLVQGRLAGIGPGAVSGGLWPFTLALVIAFAVFHPEQEVRFQFLLSLKAKYLAAIYVLVYIAMALLGRSPFDAVLALGNAAAGYGFLKLAPRRGIRVGLSERWFAMRNAYFRAKRRRAAKKFTVYMRKQGKDVSLDADGRYIDPEGTPRDPNDRRWMN